MNPGETSRREFLKTAAAAGLAATAGVASGQVITGGGPARPLFTISLAQWSLNRTIKAGQLDPLDFAKTAKQDFDIEAIEYVNQFFKDKALDTDWLKQLKQRADDNGVKSLLIMCDGEGDLGDPDPGKRAATIKNHHKWVEAAKALDCHSIRVNAASSGTPDEQRTLCADGLSRLCEFAGKHEINVLVENHGGMSSHAAWLLSVVKRVNHPRCGTLPDFGNFRITKRDGTEAWYDRYTGVRELMPYAKAVSAKSHDFDAEGNETSTDFAKMMRIVIDAKYRGYVGIEYEGGRLSEPDGIKATKALLERVRSELAAG